MLFVCVRRIQLGMGLLDQMIKGWMDMEIDIRHSCKNPGLLSRKIWEALFREVHAENFKDLDSFLCDLDFLESSIEKGYNTLHWHYDESGHTDLTLNRHHEYNVYRITLLDEVIKIERIAGSILSAAELYGLRG